VRSHWSTTQGGTPPTRSTSGQPWLALAQPGEWPNPRLHAVLNDPTYINDTIRREHSPPYTLSSISR
jgi:hypothetical protein